MIKLIKKLYRNDEGQALVLVALAMVVILGFAAIAIDYGYLAWQKSKLQNAADSAALAAAWELPNESPVNSKAREYAKSNASELNDSEIKATMQNGNKEVKVDLEHTYNTFLGGVLGSPSQKISATAIAQKINNWNGEALPFLNLDIDYAETDPKAWYHIGSGNKGTIANFYTRNHEYKEDLYYEIDYTNGIKVLRGHGNPTGLDEIKLRDNLKHIIKKSNKGKKFHIFSLSSEIIKGREFTVNGGSNRNLDKLQDLNNGDIIDPHQLVLLEVILVNAKWQNCQDIELKYTGNVYDVMNGEFPTEHLYSPSSSSKLIN